MKETMYIVDLFMLLIFEFTMDVIKGWIEDFKASGYEWVQIKIQYLC